MYFQKKYFEKQLLTHFQTPIQCSATNTIQIPIYIALV
jgi:hypothetical protein